MARKLYRRKGTDLITAIIHNEYVTSMGREDIPNRKLYQRLTKDEEFFEGLYSFYIMCAISDKSFPRQMSQIISPDNLA